MTNALQPPSDARALIFDCDGTLAITRHAHFAALNQAFAAQGLPFDEAWYLTKTGLSFTETCEAYAVDHGQSCDAVAVRLAHARLFAENRSLIRPVDQVLDIARVHHGRMPMSVASGGDMGIVEMTLTQIGHRHLFDHVVAIGQITRGKPAPDLFLAAVDLMQRAPAECFVYEDSDEGLEAAHRAGIPAVDIRTVPGLER
jgi:beta-phosphoglucomutase-like phosphatase (HAD superfamily)